MMVSLPKVKSESTLATVALAERVATASRPEGRAQVYLDVSGSMTAEMPLIVTLLGRLSRWIRRPFWAFRTGVVPALIEGGVQKAGIPYSRMWRLPQ